MTSNQVYTLDADFNLGSEINLNIANDQIELDNVTEPFNFIWVAASGRGTIIRIDTDTGQILGEYYSSPNGMARNPSRTTVDADGDVWAGNRDEASGGMGSAINVGLVVGGTRVNSAGNPDPNGQYLQGPFEYISPNVVDRNGDGLLKTSFGLGNILSWNNTGGADNNGGVSTADDELIINYIRTTGSGVRTVAVDGNNDVWIGGIHNNHQLYDGDTGNPILGAGKSFNVGAGGYGGLVDGNGVLWSASSPGSAGLVRHNPVIPSTQVINTGWTYGLGIDTNGFIWMSNWGQNTVQKIAPNGAVIGTFPTGGAGSGRGVAVTPANNHVWVANSGGSNVSRLDNNGNLLAVINLNNNPGFDGLPGGGDDNQPGWTPTGVSVDANGKVWVTNFSSDNVMRINPATNAVDLVVNLGPRASPYNYSDMTGSTLTAPPDSGSWSVVFDSGEIGEEWGIVEWNANTPGNSSLVVQAASSTNGTIFSSPETVTHGVDLTVPDGQYIKLIVTFNRSSTDGNGDGIKDSPILFDISVTAEPDFTITEADWKPNSNPSAMTFNGRGVIPVAIYGSDDFNARTITSMRADDDQDTLIEGGGANALRISYEDVNRDGILDAVAHFDKATLLGVLDTTQFNRSDYNIFLYGAAGTQSGYYLGIQDVATDPLKFPQYPPFG